MRSGFSKSVMVLVAFGLLALLFFYQLAFTDKILARGDTFAYFYPYWDARDAALANGELPLWTPDLFMGAPLLANSQLGTFYPPNWLTIAQPAPQAIKISILMHTTWAAMGAFLLAWCVAGLGIFPAIIAGILYGFGGHLGAHVEQINQLQGLAWMPWLFLLWHYALNRPARFVPLMAIAWALQLLSGHTQTVFISGVGLGVYLLAYVALTPHESRVRLLRDLIRGGLLLLLVAILAVILALPQLIPAQELTSLSNRGDGLNAQEATAFSWNPALIGRTLLPSYNGQPFAEYIAYPGLIGLVLALLGAISLFWNKEGDLRRGDLLGRPQPNAKNLNRIWLILALVGITFALGRFTPIYLTLANLPGFNLFRVPARWLALFALSAAMLAGIGVQTLLSDRIRRLKIWHLGIIVGAIGFVMALSLLSERAQSEVNGSALPSVMTFAVWVGALVVVSGMIWARNFGFVRSNPLPKSLPATQGGTWYILLLLLIIGELWLASHTLPYNDLADPDVYTYPRFAAYQMQAYNMDEVAPGRLLSISSLLFDPGDRANLEARWERMGLSDNGSAYAFTATKMQETLAANLPLAWDIPSIDGFDGGLLPTIYYSAFTSLLLPPDTLRTVDGRLREILALPECRGACIPDDRWLDLTNTRYLLMDKVYDRVVDGIFYDTAFTIPIDAGDNYTLEDTLGFVSNSVHILVDGEISAENAPEISLIADNGDTISLTVQDVQALPDDPLTLIRYTTDEVVTPSRIVFSADNAIVIHAVSLVDTRTGDFVQLAPNGWRRIYSADIKIYENLDVLPRAFIVHEVSSAPDTWAGTEQALNTMDSPEFDSTQAITLNTSQPVNALESGSADSTVIIRDYTANRITLDVTSAQAGYLLLTDAYYPGWQATANGENTSVYRADVMFRSVSVPQGDSTVVFEYRPWWLWLATPFWTWGLALVMLVAGWFFGRTVQPRH